MADLEKEGRKKNLSHRHSYLKGFAIDEVPIPIPGVLLFNNKVWGEDKGEPGSDGGKQASLRWPVNICWQGRKSWPSCQGSRPLTQVALSLGQALGILEFLCFHR